MTISGSAALPGYYDYNEVARSVVIAIIVSYVALDLAGRVTVAKGRARLAWLSGGAIAMGLGIWTMHFKGMMAFHLPVPVEYHWPTVLASLLLAILASALALYVASRRTMSWVEAVSGGAIMSAGIAGMHYVGMAAMRLPAITRYSPLFVTFSILLAILFSLIALLMAFDLREETRWTIPRRLGSGIVMGAAVSAMHYTGMAAATFIPGSPPDLSHAVNISPVGNSAIYIVTVLVLVGAMVTSSVDMRSIAEIQSLNQAALQEARDKLSLVRRMQSMGELAAAIAHEVNQPLTAIVTNANFTLRQLEGTKPNLNDVREAVAEILEDASRASTVISRIRAQLKQGSAERVELDVNELIREAANLLRSEAIRNRVSVQLDLATGLPRVLGDRVQLQQVLINLVMNSIDAMNTLTDRPRQLTIKSARNGDGVQIEVQDSGKGIPSGQAERVFEPFFTTKDTGIGLGLPISQSIVESHGGSLRAVPTSRGARFVFTLPIDREAAA